MFGCMRTTLTLDDDVAAAVERLRRDRGLTLKEVVNRALREGLVRLEEEGRPDRSFRTDSVSLGRCLLGSIDDVAEALAVAEGEGYR